MPEAAIRAKVDDYLKKCSALAGIWQRRITAGQLTARTCVGPRELLHVLDRQNTLDRDRWPSGARSAIMNSIAQTDEGGQS